MRIDHPTAAQMAQLRRLWQEAFGDEDAFLDLFFGQAFAVERCRCVSVDSQVAAALYWLDCSCGEGKLAYLYAIATAKACRGRGFCRALMADTHDFLRQQGYAGCILVPGNGPLFEMYRTMGYEVCSTVREFECRTGAEKAALRHVQPEVYAALRRQYLPAGGVIQEGENLRFLAAQMELYAAEDVLLCGTVREGVFHCPELLGDTSAAPAVLAALGADRGIFRCPGTERAFAMYYPLTDAPAPQYFGLAFD